MRIRLIDQAKKEFPVHRLCSVLGVSESGYFAWKGRPASRRQKEDLVLLAHIRAQFATSNETYGAPRMQAELKEEGHGVGRHRVARLMRDNGLKALQKRRYKKTTDSHHGGPVAANLLDQNFGCDGPDQKWGADISYIWTAEGWLYLDVMIDLHSRCVVGWAVSNRLKHNPALQAFNNAVALHNPPPRCVHHSDRGSHYCSHDYQKRLRHIGFKVSMSGKGNCYDCEYGIAA
jgi:putative transposase